MGQTRAAGYPLSTSLRHTILEKVDSIAGIEVVAMARYSTAPEAGAQIILVSEVPVPLGFVDYIEAAVRSVTGNHAGVRVTILQAAKGATPEPAEIDEIDG